MSAPGAPRVVVIGPYPPSPDPAAAAVLDLVRALRAGGASAIAVSPEPSAAPVWGDPTGFLGARRVARVVRGAERVVWFAPPGVVPARPLRRALAGVSHVDVRAGSAVSTPPRRNLPAVAARVRAGMPTWARTVGARWRRLATRGRR